MSVPLTDAISRWTGPAAEVWALVCGLSPKEIERRVLVIWRAYLDDSGHREHSPFLVLGGWVAPITVWADFVPDWDKMCMLKPPIAYFKMNEAAKRTGEFLHWSAVRATQRVVAAYEVIEKWIPYQVSVIVELEPFYRIFTTKWIEQSSINPYYLAFSAVLSGVAREQRKLGIEYPVDFIFDEQVMEKGKIVDAWGAFKINASDDTRELIGSVPQFLDDKKFKPLQAADLIAWWIRHLATKSLGGKEPNAVPWRAKREIPGFQFHYGEARLLEAREGPSSVTSPFFWRFMR